MADHLIILVLLNSELEYTEKAYGLPQETNKRYHITLY